MSITTNSYLLVKSEDRQSGSVNDLFIVRGFEIVDPAELTPISFRSKLFIENVNTFNNSFVCNGVAVVLTPGQYSISTFLTELKTKLDAATGLVFTVTNVSTFTGNNYRIRLQSAGHSIDSVTEGFSKLSGISVSPLSVDTTYSYTNLSYTDYFDLVSPEICSNSYVDQVAGKEVGSVLFRIPFNQFSMDVDVESLNDQAGKKNIRLPSSVRGTINFRLYDMFGNLLLCSGSWYLQAAVALLLR